MRGMVFRVLTPNTQRGRWQGNPDSIFQDNPDTLYKICSRIAVVLLFYESPRLVEERLNFIL